MAEVRDRIGRFEITAELGRGSMGIVHRAHDPVVGRDVAIKRILLPHGLLPDKKKEFHERFLREARAAGRLSHAGIVTVYDFNDGASDGCPFIAMEYVEGSTLHELIHAQPPLGTSWALTVGEALADALQTAHDAGIVHRDLKPANVLVRQADGVAKITDFGVARVNHSDLTGVGMTYGSPAYMAPECLRGAPADSRSDLFALAVILYEVLCRHRPFGGDDFHTTCAAILSEPPASISRHEPTLAPAFDRFFARALAKNPEERYQSGAAFRDAVRALRDEQDCFQRGETTALIDVAVAQHLSPTRPGSRGKLAAAAILLGLLVIILGWATRKPSPARTDALPQVSGAAEAPVQEARAPAPKAPAPARAVASATTPRPRPIAAKSAHLDLYINNRVKNGTLTLFVDGKEIYATPLATQSQGALRDREEILAAVDVPPGRHTLMARMVLAADSRQFERSLEYEIEPGAKRGLSIGVGRIGFGQRLTLALQ